MRNKFEPMLLDKWRLYTEGRPVSRQHHPKEQLSDPLEPGPFAPPLAPGALFVSVPEGLPAAPSGAATVAPSSAPAVRAAPPDAPALMLPAAPVVRISPTVPFSSIVQLASGGPVPQFLPVAPL